MSMAIIFFIVFGIYGSVRHSKESKTEKDEIDVNFQLSISIIGLAAVVGSILLLPTLIIEAVDHTLIKVSKAVKEYRHHL